MIEEHKRKCSINDAKSSNR